MAKDDIKTANKIALHLYDSQCVKRLTEEECSVCPHYKMCSYVNVVQCYGKDEAKEIIGGY